MGIKEILKARLSWKTIDIMKQVYYFPTVLKIEKMYLQYCKQMDIKTQKQTLAKNILSYTEQLRIDDARYRFSEDTMQESLYASIFACMIRGFYNDILDSEKESWIHYFNQCQRAEDGLFGDGVVSDALYFSERRGYGARHLAGIIINAYDRLCGTPKYEFTYLNEYKDPDKMIKWLSTLDYQRIWGSSNEILNCGAVMQFARDRMGMPFNSALEAMEDFLLKKIRKEYGLWYEGTIDSKTALYEAIRGAYHIIPVLQYDKIKIPYADKCLSLLYKSQNKWGGFDNLIGSSACADIDAIDPLLRLSIQENCPPGLIGEILDKSEKWILFNQNSDGGFVFGRRTAFQWGEQNNLFSKYQHSNIFATWFRALSLQLIDNYRNQNNQFRIQTPGSECPLFYESKPL